MNTFGKVFLSFVVGAAAGTVTGLLYAPEKGNRTRKKLAKKAENWRDDVNERWEDGSARVQDFKESAKSTAEKYGKQINKALANK